MENKIIECVIRRVVNLKFEILLTNKTHKVFDESVNNGSK